MAKSKSNLPTAAVVLAIGVLVYLLIPKGSGSISIVKGAGGRKTYNVVFQGLNYTLADGGQFRKGEPRPGDTVIIDATYGQHGAVEDLVEFLNSREVKVSIRFE